MGAFISFIIVAVLALVVGLAALASPIQVIFGVVFPYLAISIFIVGVIYRVYLWAKSPVPFRITTTCGQQKTLSWIKPSNLENPHNVWGVIGRMLLEILFFRSLFRNTRIDVRDDGPVVAYGSNKWLWLFALMFHWSFLLIVIRHLRFFTEPVPFFVSWTQDLEGFLQIGVPTLYLSGIFLLVAVTYLFLRRVLVPQLRYISLPADYFPLFLIFGIGFTGVLLRHFYKIDVVAVKELVIGLVGFNPSAPEGIGALFFVHLFLVCTLLAYFPFSKLMHMGGVFLSPTRNLANTNRMQRHINPWNPKVDVHTYEEWEDDFRDVMKASGYPVEKE